MKNTEYLGVYSPVHIGQDAQPAAEYQLVVDEVLETRPDDSEAIIFREGISALRGCDPDGPLLTSVFTGNFRTSNGTEGTFFAPNDADRMWFSQEDTAKKAVAILGGQAMLCSFEPPLFSLNTTPVIL